MELIKKYDIDVDRFEYANNYIEHLTKWPILKKLSQHILGLKMTLVMLPELIELIELRRVHEQQHSSVNHTQMFIQDFFGTFVKLFCRLETYKHLKIDQEFR